MNEKGCDVMLAAAAQAEADAVSSREGARITAAHSRFVVVAPHHAPHSPDMTDQDHVSKQPVTRKTAIDRMLETTFLATVASASILFGFGMTIAIAKKKDPSMFAKGLIGTRDEVAESGGRLAMRALGWGTVYSVTGFSVFCYAVWKLMGVQNLQEFRAKAGSLLPRIPKHEPQGRTEFESLRDLMTFLSEDGK